jgi:carbon monoxide dehydrogenase subunit G
MAMTMTGEVTLHADRDTVWTKLNDPEALKAAIPGCQDLEKIGDTAFRATVKLKVGPVGAVFKGSVELTDIDPPNGYRIVGQGEGGIAGFAKGGARVRLHDIPDAPESCKLEYEVNAEVGGKIAQLGSRLINGVASKTADQFFNNFAEALK